MALGKCKECGGQVAKSAKVCPHCGAKQPKSVGVIGWLFVIFVVVPVAWAIGTSMSDSDPAPSSSASRPATAPAAPAEPVPRWKEWTGEDGMTGDKIKTVSLRSENGVEFDFPYKQRGGSHLTVTFRERGSKLDAYMRIDKGQMLCSRIECAFSLRVGEGPVQQWTGSPSSTNDSDMMFIRDAAQLEKIMASGQPVRIGLKFYQAGTSAFQFDTSEYPGR